MKISYQWLKEYLPSDEYFSTYVQDANEIAKILTSVGLEVEAIDTFESVKGGLKGLIIGEVLTCEKHPNADKLKITTVSTGKETDTIVCGAPNVAVGQKVVVAPIGTTLYPVEGDSFTIQKAKIRGIESKGMLCAEDEIGIGKSHAGIIVLPAESQVGSPVAEFYEIYSDIIFEIGLTPNRMDNQSHLGVAKDICAWLSHHTGKAARVVSPLGKPFHPDTHAYSIEVLVKDPVLCPRYSGVTLSGIQIQESPQWLKNKLLSLGLKPINNIVDVTNFVLHTTGQPLHAFDADKIAGRKVIVETLPKDTPFLTLDQKERKLSDEDIMICDAHSVPMCIAGVFGGWESGVSNQTKNIFLESAVFNGNNVRKSIFRHDLRTDAATRFEKGVDISKTTEVLKYAATLIKELSQGKISSEVVDIFTPPGDRIIRLEFAYLKKLSGRDFSKAEAKGILSHLGFGILEESDQHLTVKAPESNPDITIPADLVEEILRISGLDQVEIPKQIRMTPGTYDHSQEFMLREKVISWLTGNGFMEIFTNSITNSDYYTDRQDVVHIINSLSEGLNIMRPDMLPTALETIAYNINRKNKDLLLFEFGKSYSVKEGGYAEKEHLAIYGTGSFSNKTWNTEEKPVSIYYLKGIAQVLLALAGLNAESAVNEETQTIIYSVQKKEIGTLQQVKPDYLKKFSIKQPVYYLDFDWNFFLKAALRQKTTYQPVSKYPSVSRDLSMTLNRKVLYSQIEEVIYSLKIKRMKQLQMFDLYESDKIGKEKKSIALNFIFADPEKTLTDQETDGMMKKIMQTLTEKLQAEIRSHV